MKAREEFEEERKQMRGEIEKYCNEIKYLSERVLELGK